MHGANEMYRGRGNQFISKVSRIEIRLHGRSMPDLEIASNYFDEPNNWLGANDVRESIGIRKLWAKENKSRLSTSKQILGDPRSSIAESNKRKLATQRDRRAKERRNRMENGNVQSRRKFADCKLAPLIKRYIKTAIISGAVVQTKGSGASGSFKLPVSAQEKIKAKKAKIPGKKAVEKKVLTKKSASSKKTAKSIKKAAVPLKKVRPSKSVPVNKAKVTGKSIAKSKKTAKALAIKTKTPKPKKVTAAKSVKATGRK
ncbi:uncharacterized protein LOC143182542 [Calliopsis andreniformis]|uniref:uncharacterized protein LOC143182542 n=1 Tax=Calliopsis andreniformis TaxID=337506 RepID=UPI003FCCA0EA